jgi:ribosomal protein S25
MGGAKKKSMAKTLKQQKKQTQKQEDQSRKKGKKKKIIEKMVGDVDLPNIPKKNLLADLKAMKAITPYTVASKYNLRQSVAKGLINKLKEEGIVTIVSGNSRLRIYKVTS